MQADKKNYFSTTVSVIQTLLIIVVVIIGLASFSSRVPFLSQMGLTFYAITSGSMEPAIPTGSLIYAGRYKIEELKPNDIVTFKIAGENDAPVAIVTHRVDKAETVDLTPEEKDEAKKKIEYRFTTKGDANQEPDNLVLLGGDILGKYKWHIPYLGYVSSYAQTQNGFLLLVITPAVILIIWEIISVIQHFKKEYAHKSEKEIALLKEELEEHKKKNDK